MRYLQSYVAIVVCGLLSLLMTVAVSADGKGFARPEYAKMPVPDQQAVLIYDDQTQMESLVIQTHFVPEKVVKGEGAEIAWVVPLPSVPQVSQVDGSLVKSLATKTGPQVVGKGDVTNWLLGVLVLGIFALQFVYAWRNPRKKHRVVETLTVFLIIVLLIGVLLPSLGSARRGASAVETAGVSVEGRQSVGPYEITTVSADESNVLLDYLDGLGVRVPDEAKGVIDGYVGQGWRFACIELRMDELGDGGVSPDPLKFDFKTDRAVYPLAITAVENEACTIDLYVVGRKQAAMEGFELKCAAALEKGSYGEAEYERYEVAYGEGVRKIYYEPHQKVVFDAFGEGEGDVVLTRLSRAFEKGEMKDDAYVAWAGYAPYRGVLYSYGAAKKRGMNAWMFVMLVVVVVGGCVVTRKRLRAKSLAKFLAIAIVLPTVAYGAGYWSVEKVETSGGKYPAVYEMHLRSKVMFTALVDAFDHANVERAISTEELRDFVADVCANPSEYLEDQYRNLVREYIVEMGVRAVEVGYLEDGKDGMVIPMKHEPTAWNYVVAEIRGERHLVLYDGEGRPYQRMSIDEWIDEVVKAREEELED